MAYSNSFTFTPGLGDIVLYSYGLCGIRRTAILQEHMADAHMAANLLLADWSTKGVNLWQVSKATITLETGVGEYDVSSETLVMLDTYLTVPDGMDRIMLPVSRTEFASYPRKDQQGVPTVFWMDRQLPGSGVFHIWPVPDRDTYTLTYYFLSQAQDANYANAQQPAVPQEWLYAFATGLAEKLAMSWAPERLAFLSPIAEKAYDTASRSGVETATQYISPQIGGYYRN
jgi:hypothetical protein